jgi:cytochrome P450
MHTAYRRILNPWFTVDAMTKLEPHLQQFAEKLVDEMLEKDEFDFVADFADPFPAVIFCELAGFPLEDYARIMDWKNLVLHATDGHGGARELVLEYAREQGREIDGGEPSDELAQQARARAGLQVYEYFQGLVEERRARPRDDLVSKLVAARYEGERPLTQEEILDTLFLLFMAGLDTVASALGLMLQTFAQNPAKRREFVELMEDPKRIGPAIEELVRYHAIVLVPRRVTRDLPFQGALFRKEDQVLVPTQAPNRDPEEFERPDELIFDRLPNRHFGFGMGPHRCLGIHLARRELRIALQVFHRRLPDYRLHPDRPVEVFGGMKGVSRLWLVKD